MKKYTFIRNLLDELNTDNIVQLKYSFRVWTRGDGCRYKDMDYIAASNVDNIDIFWNRIKETQKYEDGPLVKGEFGSDPYSPSIFIKGFILIKRTNSIDYATKSILKNSDVWHSKAA